MDTNPGLRREGLLYDPPNHPVIPLNLTFLEFLNVASIYRATDLGAVFDAVGVRTG